MTAFNPGPCGPWDPIWPCPIPTGAEAVSGVAVMMATEVLWKRTGQRFGTCESTLRPCAKDCLTGIFPNGIIPFSTRYPYPYQYRGMWYNLGCAGCSGTCSCTMISEALLPAPVADVLEVKVDGEILPDTAYRVDDQYKLVRLDGDIWPRCNDLTKNDDVAGTWSVTATFGEVVPESGRLAVGELAIEFMRALLCDSSCGLPPNVQEITRQGVTQNFFRGDLDMGNNRLGLYFSDLFISTWNPHGISRPARGFDVDGSNFRRAGT